MSDEEECECPECPAGLPAYLATFADLMSLLMCFFVLLLAFSEMDIQKYKQVAGSMKDAFGVQDKIKLKEMPKGTSIIAQEFSPGRPDPTPLNEVRQSTTETLQNTLDVLCAPGESKQRKDEDDSQSEASGGAGKSDHSAEILERLIAMTQADAVDVASAMKDEIQSGAVEVETRNRRIVIRVKEQGSFESGSATLRATFIPIMDRIRDAIKDVDGEYSVEGHTDDIPISTARFRSNWELASARAVSVAHELLKNDQLDKAKFTVVGFGETKPMAENDTEENRSRNRRVEIVIEQGADDEKFLSGEVALPDDPEFSPEILKEAGIENLDGFELLSGEEADEQTDLAKKGVISVLEDDVEADANTEVDTLLKVEENGPGSIPDALDLEPVVPKDNGDDEFF